MKLNLMRTIRSTSLDIIPRSSAGLSQHQPHQLSDIVEASLSSRQGGRPVEDPQGQHVSQADDMHNSASSQHDPDTTSPEFVTPPFSGAKLGHARWASRAVSAISLPLCEIPERRSSMSNFNQNGNFSRRLSLHNNSMAKSDPPRLDGSGLPNSRRAESPVRQSLARGAQSSEALRRSPSHTFIRTTPPTDILDNGLVQHPRFQLLTRLSSPLFVGGGTVEGQLELRCDQSPKKTKLQPMWISKLSVDVFGVEEVSDGKRHAFLALASELFDMHHPPPPALVTNQEPIKGSELLWQMRPAQATVPFCINLPLNLGPPPYASKGASIKYILCSSATIKIGHKRSVVRHSLLCQMLPVYDPEKALGSLPSPLIAFDYLTLAQAPGQVVKLTAGLHRQTWINGGVLFIDLHVVNSTTRLLKRIDVQLEKSTLFYAHAAAGTANKSASHLRLPKRNETEIVKSVTFKKSNNWQGILPQSSEIRTCELDIPRGHVTISGGRYFEVRYFVRVLVSVNMFKTLAVQLPVTIIHMNSLDILPNALSQVAASIEAKRARTVPVSYDGSATIPFTQGGVFEAARRQSLDKFRTDHGDHPETGIHGDMFLDSMTDLSHTLCKGAGGTGRDAFKGQNPASHHHHERHPSCYHCHITDHDFNRPHSSGYQGPKLPRLQVSTSGLGFSESEFEIPPDSPPRKVMLSESERQMIRQQRELKMQRQWSRKSTKKENTKTGTMETGNATGYHNVAARSSSVIPFEIGHRLSMPVGLMGRGDLGNARALTNVTTPNRKRSKTNPEVMKPMGRRLNMTNPIRPGFQHGRHEVRSMDRGYRHPKSANVVDDGDVFYDVKAPLHPSRPGRFAAMYDPRA